MKAKHIILSIIAILIFVGSLFYGIQPRPIEDMTAARFIATLGGVTSGCLVRYIYKDLKKLK